MATKDKKQMTRAERRNLRRQKKQNKKKERERKLKEKRNKQSKKIQKRRDKKARKRQKHLNLRDKNNLFAPISGYSFTPSYIKGNKKRYASIVKVVNKLGLNRNMQFGWFINLIPEILVDGDIKAYLVESDKPVDEKTQRNIMTKEIQKTIRSQDPSNDREHETGGDRKTKDIIIDDLFRASRGDASNESIIDSHIYIMLVSDNPDLINEQIRKLNTLYNDNMNGVSLMSAAGNQKNLFNNILDAPEGSVYEYTWMSGDFSGNDHAVRKGLDDVDGAFPIGTLTESYTSGIANMSLNNSFKKRVVVAAPEESYIHGYDEELSASSMWGQIIANNAMCHDHRIFHIVMNGFEYYGEPQVEGEEKRFDAEPIMNTEIERYDLSKSGLNPLEMFGDREKDDISQVYNTNLNKITHMFNLMSDRQLDSKSSRDSKMNTTMIDLMKALNQFYEQRKLWTKNAHNNPNEARIFGITDHESFPVMGQFIQKLQTLLLEASTTGSATDQDNAKALHGTLQNALDRYRGIFNNPTTLEDPRDVQKLQLYYDLSKLRTSPEILEAQFLNVFDYIAQATERDDIIMIHGVDNLSTETLEIIRNRIQAISRRGVRFAYLFDRIGSGDSEKKSKVEYADIFNTDGLLYTNFDSQFDYSILGTMTVKELERYQEKVKQKLTQNLIDTLTNPNAPIQYQVRRQKDLTTAMVLADFLV